jgi:hypothetical protein
MSKSTNVLANHSLNTSSVADLALDLSNRLKINIEYGYGDNCTINPDKTQRNPSYNYVVLGSILNYKSDKTYMLTEENYELKKIALQILKNDELEIKDTDDEVTIEMKTSLKEVEYDLEYNASHYQKSYFTIHKESLQVWYEDSLYWWSFCENVTINTDEENAIFINKWRKRNRDWIQKLGGTSMFVCCYEADSYSVLDNGLYDSWINTKKFAVATFKEKILHIAKHFQSAFYLSKQSGFYYETKYELPLAFFDDFKDLLQ